MKKEYFIIKKLTRIHEKKKRIFKIDKKHEKRIHEKKNSIMKNRNEQ